LAKEWELEHEVAWSKISVAVLFKNSKLS